MVIGLGGPIDQIAAEIEHPPSARRPRVEVQHGRDVEVADNSRIDKPDQGQNSATPEEAQEAELLCRSPPPYDLTIEPNGNECREQGADDAEKNPGYAGIQPKLLKTAKQEEMGLKIYVGCVVARVWVAVEE